MMCLGAKYGFLVTISIERKLIILSSRAILFICSVYEFDSLLTLVNKGAVKLKKKTSSYLKSWPLNAVKAVGDA